MGVGKRNVPDWANPIPAISQMKTEDQFQAWILRLDKEQSRALEERYYGDPANRIRFESEKKGGAMQREFDDVELLLNMWADWMHRPEPIADGYPEKASGGFVPSWCKDTQEAAEGADAETVVKVNAAFDSLQRIYQDAINRHYGLGSQVWQFAKAASFEDAKIGIRVKFVTKGLL
jgi:hypothetical protein